MEGDEETTEARTLPRTRSGSGRLSWSRRDGQRGHSRSWTRISLGSLNPSKRRDKESQAAVQARGRSSPIKRRTTLGGGGTVRDDGGLAGGVGTHLGKHGIRYSMTAHTDSWVEDLKQEESLSDPGGNRPSFSSPPRLSSSSSGPLPTTARKYTGEHQSTDTIAEELEDYTAEDEPNGISHVGHGGGLGGDETGGVQEPQDSLDRHIEERDEEYHLAQGVDLSQLDAQRDGERNAGDPGGGGGQLTPTSRMSGSRRSNSRSPTPSVGDRRRMSSCGRRGNSPPPTSGPFSRPRSKSRSPRHTHRASMSGAPLEGVGGGLGMPRLRKEHSRRSTMGFDQNGATPFEREQPLLANDPGDSSRSEEVAEWSENEASAEAGAGEEDNKTAGPFTENSLEMARLRLPNMELGFEDEGLFGIDVRRLIIGREIARGAFGVVHEAELLEEVPSNEDVEDAEQSGPISKVTVSDGENEDPDAVTNTNSNSTTADKSGEGRASAGNAAPPPEGGAITTASSGAAVKGDVAGTSGVEDATSGEAGVKEGGPTDTAGVGAGEGGSGGEGKNVERVAVKIQQVPLDEEEQANLLGELAMLRHYQHPHLVGFIGTAIAMERGVDTVMLAMELCCNGALRETLKLDITWPLKVRIAGDMAAGLNCLHEHGIIHRDIKTPNVLIDSAWRAKLCDYNFAIDESSTIKQDFCAGTAEFMSPEVLLSEDYGLPSDIFSLGMIFVEMLTGKEPSPTFPERPPQLFFVVSEEEIQAELLEGCPQSFSLLLSQCLDAEPSERPTAGDVHGWLEELLHEIGPDEIALPQRKAPLPVLTEGAAIAREGNVINASPKVSQGTGHHWMDSEDMELQVTNMVERAVESALAEREHLNGGSDGMAVREVGGGLGEEGEARLEEMQQEIDTLRNACEERDSRISELEVQALRNTATLKMLSSALEVAYKMLEGQQAGLLQSNLEEDSRRVSPGEDAIHVPGESAVRNGSSLGDSDDFDELEARLSRHPSR